MAKKIFFIFLAALVGLIVIIPIALKLTGSRSGLPGGQENTSSGDYFLRSEDSGNTWTAVSSNEEKTKFPTGIQGLTFHPQDSNQIFLGTKSSGLWKSSDAGKSWKKVKDKNEVLKPESAVYKVEINRSNPRIIYLALYYDNYGRILKSQDGGESFQQIYALTEQRFGVFDLYNNPYNADDITIITGQGGLLQTLNSGQTWKVKKWFGEPLSALLINTFSPGEIYVIARSKTVYKTTDDGENWTTIDPNVSAENETKSVQFEALNPFATGAGGLKLETFALDYSSPNTLYSGLADSVRRSTNKGNAWKDLKTIIPPESLPSRAIAINPQNSNEIYLGANKQIYRSRDWGQNWSVLNPPVRNKIQTIYVNTLNPKIVFVLSD